MRNPVSSDKLSNELHKVFVKPAMYASHSTTCSIRHLLKSIVWLVFFLQPECCGNCHLCATVCDRVVILCTFCRHRFITPHVSDVSGVTVLTSPVCMSVCYHSQGQTNRHTQWSRKLFLVCQTKCPAGLQRSAGHFEPLSDIFPSRWLANINGHSCCPNRTFYVYLSELSAGHQQKSAGHVRHISRSLHVTGRL